VRGFVFEASDLMEADVDELERDLRVEIRGTFRDLLLKYNFGNLTLGFVAFGNDSTNAGYFRDENKPDSPWSAGGSNLLVLGQTDGFTVLIDAKEGTVFSVEVGSESREMVARDLRLLLEAVGTLVMIPNRAGSESIVDEVCEHCGCDCSSRFWYR
jgi:hypothetical protein